MPRLSVTVLVTPQRCRSWRRCSEGDQSHREPAVEVDDIVLRVIEHGIAHPTAAVLQRRAQVGLGKMRVIKPEDGRVQLPPGAQRGPGHMIRIARLDDVRADFVEEIEYQLRVQDQPVARRVAREKIEPRRADRMQVQTPLALVPSLGPGNDEVMLVARVGQDVAPLLRDVALHAAAHRRVKLGDVADLHARNRGGDSWRQVRGALTMRSTFAVDVEKGGDRLAAVDALDRLAQQFRDAEHGQLEAGDGPHDGAVGG